MVESVAIFSHKKAFLFLLSYNFLLFGVKLLEILVV